MKKQCLCLLFLMESVISALAHAQTRFEQEKSNEQVCKTIERKPYQATRAESSSAKEVQLIPSIGKPLFKLTAEGVSLFEYEQGLLMREFGTKRTGTYVYDRYGRFDRLIYSDGTSVVAAYGDEGQLMALSTLNNSAVNLAYSEQSSNVAVTPSSNANAFHTALSLVSNQRAGSKTEGQAELDSCTGSGTKLPGGFFSNAEDPPPDGTPIVTVQGTRDGPSGVDYVPIGGPGRGGGGGGGPKPQPHPWNKNPKPGYPPDTFTEDYPPFDLPPEKCKDWCMKSDSIAHGMCRLIKRPDRKALCHQQINGFTSNCLRSCDTGDWSWLRD